MELGRTQIARTLMALLGVATTSFALAQIPDLLNAYDAGGRSMGVGGSLNATGSTPASALNNPAGLAYINEPTLSLAFRNLNETSTALTGTFTNPDQRTTGKAGNRTLTQLGYAMPMGRKGTLGISYQIGGHINDLRTGASLTDGGSTIVNYANRLKVKTDFLTIALSRSNADMTQTFGIGLVLASMAIRDQEQYSIQTGGGNPVPVAPLDNQGTRVGVGVVVGGQFAMGQDQTVGFSLRSPISLNGGGDVEGYAKQIPMKASVGLTRRIANPRRTDDFALVSVQGDAYFGSDNNSVINRDNQLVVSGGIEYNYRIPGAYVPIRLGFRSLGKGGDRFKSVSGLTYGIGYSPDNGRFTVDIDFGNASGGGNDLSIGLTYRVRK